MNHGLTDRGHRNGRMQYKKKITVWPITAVEKDRDDTNNIIVHTFSHVNTHGLKESPNQVHLHQCPNRAHSRQVVAIEARRRPSHGPPGYSVRSFLRYVSVRSVLLRDLPIRSILIDAPIIELPIESFLLARPR